MEEKYPGGEKSTDRGGGGGEVEAGVDGERGGDGERVERQVMQRGGYGEVSHTTITFMPIYTTIPACTTSQHMLLCDSNSHISGSNQSPVADISDRANMHVFRGFPSS